MREPSTCPSISTVEGSEKPRPPGSVHRFLQALAGLELRLHARLDLHRLAGARVAAGRGLSLRDGKGAEPDQAHFVAALQRTGDRVENRFNSLAGIGTIKTRRLGDRANQLLLVHARWNPQARRRWRLARSRGGHLRTSLGHLSKGKRPKIAVNSNGRRRHGSRRYRVSAAGSRLRRRPARHLDRWPDRPPRSTRSADRKSTRLNSSH